MRVCPLGQLDTVPASEAVPLIGECKHFLVYCGSVAAKNDYTNLLSLNIVPARKMWIDPLNIQDGEVEIVAEQFRKILIESASGK
jgi:hypothetical protein